MTTNHSYFEVLCALAAAGQLTSSELAELDAHSEGCQTCACRLAEMTQVSAELFCAHAASQPGIRMKKGMLERFIARANSEGVPLTARPASAGLSGPAVTAALLVAVLLIFATAHFGTFSKSSDAAGQWNMAIVAHSVGNSGEALPKATGTVAANETSARRTNAGQRARHEKRGRTGSNERPSVMNLPRLESSQLDLTVYSRNLPVLRRLFATANLGQNSQWSAGRYGVPRFHFSEPAEFVRDDPPRLLAEYEQQMSAPWSPRNGLAPGHADAQVLRRDFDPNAYTMLLNPDFKKNLPAFQLMECAAVSDARQNEGLQ